MAAGAEEKTEEPTAKRKKDARRKGNVAKSKDLGAALVLLAAIQILKLLGPYMARFVRDFMEKMISQSLPSLEAPEGKEIIPFAMEWAWWMLHILGPFLLFIAIAAYLANYVQIGWLVSTEQLKFDPKKLNPVSGLKRIFSAKNVVMLIMNIAKLVVVLAVGWSTVFYELQNIAAMVEMETAGTFVWTVEKVLSMAQRLAIILLILGLVDFYYQRYKHNKDLKMTKQEVKEEFKQMEGDPKIKQKRRQKQMEMAMNRMMQEVPQAEVVVRNPTHYAVAISFKLGMAAPVVVAKGKNKIAERIIETAREHRVPLVENPPLARELYKRVEVGNQIPPELFAAVAEILSSVMDAEKKRQMMRSLSEAA
ncbi:MAG: flagellar biosynthesis protein FlhB [Planctomycetes bacterium]|nr:flagellar biosynthesis protein FlhB [Planctomycetota bacterium]